MLVTGFAVIVSVYAATAYTHSTKTAPATDAPIVDLGYAVHRATVNDTGFQYYNFSNIRYGAPPIGDLRFAASIPPKHINRTINDGQQAVTCSQAYPIWFAEVLSGTPVNESTTSTSSLDISQLPEPDAGTSEDCLFLDVIVPKSIFDKADVHRKGPAGSNGYNGTGNGAPVLVWISGGGFTVGSKVIAGSPATLIYRSRDSGGDGIVYVSINYRLGLYGWLSGPTFQESGTANAGLYDQELALQWVRHNIHLFGGDPNRVTVMGQSAGGASILHQITAYGGLKGNAPFHQAIIQSPGFQVLNNNARAESIYQQTLSSASLITGRNIATIEDLRGLSAIELFKTNYAIVGLSPYGRFTYGPSVDGKFVPKLPGELLLHGQYDKSLNVMVGHNLNEGLLFTSQSVRDEATFEASIDSIIPDLTTQALQHITKTMYPPIFDGSKGYTSQQERADLLNSELSFTCNTRYLDLAYQNKTYSYYFTAPPGVHGDDIAYTFFNGDTTTPNYGTPVNATVARALQHYITSFVMHGNPNGVGESSFPIYGTNSSTQVLGFGDLGTQVRDTVANERCSYWQKALYT